MRLLRFVAWLTAHAADIGAAMAALTVVLRGVYAVVSATVKPYPRLRAIVEAVAAASPDVMRGVVQLLRAVTGKDVPSVVTDARDEKIATLTRELATARAEQPAPETP